MNNDGTLNVLNGVKDWVSLRDYLTDPNGANIPEDEVDSAIKVWKSVDSNLASNYYTALMEAAKKPIDKATPKYAR